MFALVVGARGFIGSVLVDDLLARNISVDCVTRGSLPTEHRPGVRWLRLDHQSQPSWDEIVANRYDVIYHLGWSTIPRTAELDPIGRSDRKCRRRPPPVACCEALRSEIAHHLHLIGRHGLRANGECRRRRNTSDEPDFRLRVGQTDVRAVSRDLPRRTRSGLRECTGFQSLRARPKHQSVFRSYFHIRSASASWSRIADIWIDFYYTRDFIYISDVGSALIALLELKNLPECINIGSGEGVRLIEVIGIIENLLNRKIAYKIQAPRPFDVQEIVLDISALRSISDWKSSIRPKDGIARLISYYTSSGRLSAS